MEFKDVVELKECRLSVANEYLAHGYKLLVVESLSGTATHPDGKSHFVRRMLCYVLGRSADTPPYVIEARPAKSPPAAEGKG